MQAGVLLGVAVGGACGAVARHGVSVLAQRAGDGFPWGTLAVNVLGCVAIGAILALMLTPVDGPRWEASPAVRAAVIIGFVGSFTTFSTYAWETFDLASNGKLLRAGAYLLLSNAIGLAAVWAGWKVFGRVGG